MLHPFFLGPLLLLLQQPFSFSLFQWPRRRLNYQGARRFFEETLHPRRIAVQVTESTAIAFSGLIWNPIREVIWQAHSCGLEYG